MTTLHEGLTLDDLAQHLYSFLPGKPHPYAAQDLSFPGVAAELGLSFPPGYGGIGSECHAAARMAIPSMLARASAGVR